MTGTRKATRKSAKFSVTRTLNAVKNTATRSLNYAARLINKGVKTVGKFGGVLVKNSEKAVGNIAKRASRRSKKGRKD
uniref:Uncharacterized protein n=1 Tax=viral metagenome TaxID=1070528 RepID=A0A6C0JWX8_9ZZZZ